MNIKILLGMALFAVSILVLPQTVALFAGMQIFTYTPTTNACIPCHDGVNAPFKRPHNDTVMCENCHGTNAHNMRFIQPDGTLGTNKSTAATCIDCHETGVPGFNSPIISNMKHSSKIDNGSVWGSYWSSERNNISCIYCHGNTKHDTIALGKIINLTDDVTNERNGSISITTWCADCHYNNTINHNYKGYLWNPVPPLITINNTNDNNRWIDHTNSNSLNGSYSDAICNSCHPINGTYPNFSSRYVHSITHLNYTEEVCRNCHGITVNRHHLLVQNGGYQCTDCHKMIWDNLSQSYNPEIIRNCPICHPGKH